MPTPILMPALSPTMEEGTLAKWNVKEGDKVAPGDVIAEIETDKATMEVEAVDEGVIGKILVEAGAENVKVNEPIAVLLQDGESADDIDLEKLNGAAAPAPEARKEESPADARGEETPADGKEKKEKDEAPKAPAFVSAASDPALPDDVEMVSTTVRDALRDAMAEEMRRDETVFLMGEEVAEYQGAYKVSRGLLEEFGPKRVVDTPITEYGFAGLGVGAAFAGLKPIVEFMTWNFAMQAIDHIINSAAKTRYMSGGQMGSPIVFRGPNAAASRVAAQHSQDYAPWYAHVPGLIVIAPWSAADAKGLLKAAIRDPNPVVFLEHELLYGDAHDVPKVEDWVLPIGKAKIQREGSDVTIVSYSRGVKFALEAAENLAEEGISAEVVDLRTLRPMDVETVVESVKKTNRLVTVEEAWAPCGIGAEVGWQVVHRAFDWLDAPPARVTQEDVPLPYAANLEVLSLPNADKIVKAAKAVLYKD
ncbi:pyruvate dehydrogenase complex E1 component subunit beta [Amphiplicatus metriothermophilus]|uniref:Pyruvate dehydrogenase E1 component subunit beta n=1 Tax=Amphiplicatus metriothermophilus TaxID=1519374 RepID=A0A239Q0V1_9PROT|nr:pyruvate dehydrogenase complex E1 component subunit beta [Amphiplicatus metriothermophilus]MBB5520066.1 pyruvate dehydrogenase E1 component beta subunit [Amphiplicatus metriothermophilus]SNT75856.1 pyruvate dehydrogenase E1 component beta subunit [Amphiplicatus metriothermophilus]